jgi:predicted AlkP superfamily pyrophosphatase or phosphodiesterase
LVGGEKVWDALRAIQPGATVANVCWWYAMGAATDWTVTPRPIYYADGRKEPDFYTDPAELHDDLTARIGGFPLFDYWGPTASIASSRWIVAAAGRILTRHRPDVLLVYVPHLDYDLQRHGPDGPQAIAAAAAVDVELRPLLESCRDRGDQILALSEYGITAARRPVDINRALRRAGLLAVHTQDGMEYLDPWTSRAFAVADHQIAHIYVADPADVTRVRGIVMELSGVDEVLDADGKAAKGIDHLRSGELVAVAEPDAWFTYYYWLDDTRAKLRAATALARKKAGLRYLMNVIGLDASAIGGSHGRLPDSAADAPLLICSDPTMAKDRIAATEVKDLIVDLHRRVSC